jgi:ribonuclease H2 subunit A
VAKVVRDRMTENWKFSERLLTTANNTNFGSGYPSDPVCKAWMEENMACRIFGFPDVVRFSWGPAKKALLQNATKVVFAADAEDEQEEDMEMAIGRKRQQEQMSVFLGRADARRKRFPYFERKGLLAVTKIE